MWRSLPALCLPGLLIFTHCTSETSDSLWEEKHLCRLSGSDLLALFLLHEIMSYDNPVKSASCEGRHIQLDLSSKSRKNKDKFQKGPATSDSLMLPVLLTWKNQGHTSTLNEKRWECSLSCQLLCLSYPTRASRQWIQTMFPYIKPSQYSRSFPFCTIIRVQVRAPRESSATDVKAEKGKAVPTCLLPTPPSFPGLLLAVGQKALISTAAHKAGCSLDERI